MRLLFGGNYDTLLPWILGALAWGNLTTIILTTHLQHGGAQLQELWYLLSLLWAQFGFAAAFSHARQHRWRRLLLDIPVTLLPPAVVYLLVFVFRAGVFRAPLP